MASALERRRWVARHADGVRRAIVNEPRGHRDMYGAILLPPYREDADICLLFMHNEGYSTMCGHGVIAVTTALIEEGLYPASEPVTTITYEVPAGIVAASASVTCSASPSSSVRISKHKLSSSTRQHSLSMGVMMPAARPTSRHLWPVNWSAGRPNNRSPARLTNPPAPGSTGCRLLPATALACSACPRRLPNRCSMPTLCESGWPTIRARRV